MLFCVSHISLLISVVLLAIALSLSLVSRALFFVMSLIFILSREISALSFCVNAFYRDIIITISTDSAALFSSEIFCVWWQICWLEGSVVLVSIFLDVMVSSRR